MVDVRRALPAVPAALSCGALAMALVPPDRGVRPEVTVAAGIGVAVAAAIGLYREMAGWSERSRRRLGYTAAAAVAVVVAAGFLFAAFGTSLCGLWGEQCTDAELARVDRYLALAPTGFAGVIGAYTILDLATRPRR
ncbi:MAG TPA: hypothetical protein VKB57_14070 [Acidimicrobiales bacterium]|nr:hypothetical protein [Acidimicrobiales bacterium]